MDFNFAQNNSASQKTGSLEQSFVGVVENEKQRLATGYAAVVEEIQAKRNKENAGAQIFPASVASLHPDVVDFLLNFDLVSVYDDIAKQNNLDEKGRSSLPQIVWKLVREGNWNALDETLEAKIPLVHSVHVNVANLLQQNILAKVKALSEKPVSRKGIISEATKKIVSIPLKKALLDYPKLGEQNVTISQIELKYFPTPVRPSIKNWITDFHDQMGAIKHSPIDRGNYLFHSENGKKLTSLERQKLSMILKSLDEDTNLDIDAEAQVLIFEIEKPQINPVANDRYKTVVSDNFTDVQKNVPAEQLISRPVLDFGQRQQTIEQEKQSEIENSEELLKSREEKLNNLGKFFGEKAGLQPEVKTPADDNLEQVAKPQVKPLSSEQATGGLKAALNFFKLNKVKNSKSEERENQVPTAEIMQKDLFKLPTSKPQLGTEEYNVRKSFVEQSNVEEKKAQELPFQSDMISNVNNVKFSNSDNIHFSSPQKLPAEEKFAAPAKMSAPNFASNSMAYVRPTATFKVQDVPAVEPEIVTPAPTLASPQIKADYEMASNSRISSTLSPSTTISRPIPAPIPTPISAPIQQVTSMTEPVVSPVPVFSPIVDLKRDSAPVPVETTQQISSEEHSIKKATPAIARNPFRIVPRNYSEGIEDEKISAPKNVVNLKE